MAKKIIHKIPLTLNVDAILASDIRDVILEGVTQQITSEKLDGLIDSLRLRIEGKAVQSRDYEAHQLIFAAAQAACHQFLVEDYGRSALRELVIPMLQEQLNGVLSSLDLNAILEDLTKKRIKAMLKEQTQ